MRALAIAFFLAGLLLWIRVMFFGVRRDVRDVGDERFVHRAWPLGLAVLFVAAGALLYARPVVTVRWIAAVSLMGLVAAVAAWWGVKRSASIPSSDPEDDPRYRFQGHVARVTRAFVNGAGGRIAFSYDGKSIELDAAWSPEGGTDRPGAGRLDDEVVIERIEGDVAYVEPWAVVEGRL
jgi:hypothetical protein